MSLPTKKETFKGFPMHERDAGLCYRIDPLTNGVEGGSCPNFKLNEDLAGSGLMTEEDHLKLEEVVNIYQLCFLYCPLIT